jgi:phosphoglycolate phosphatase
LGKKPLRPNISNAALRLAVFDCDGTLVDSAHSIISSMQAACSNLGHHQPESGDIRRTVGLPVEDAVARLFPEMKHDHVWAVREEFRKIFVRLRDKGEIHEPLYDGVVEMLRALDGAGWLLGVATGKSLSGLKSTLNIHDLHHHFVTLQTADLSIGKPDPDMLHKAMRDTGVDKKRTVMIGDTSFDMEMARNAGTLAIGVTWGYHDVEELLEAGAQGVVANFFQIPQAIADLLKAETC